MSLRKTYGGWTLNSNTSFWKTKDGTHRRGRKMVQQPRITNTYQTLHIWKQKRTHKNEDEPTESRVVKQVLFAILQKCKQTALVWWLRCTDILSWAWVAKRLSSTYRWNCTLSSSLLGKKKQKRKVDQLGSAHKTNQATACSWSSM